MVLRAPRVGRVHPQLARTLANDLFIGRTLAWDTALEKRVESLTAEQIVAALRRHLDLSKMTFVKAGDFEKASASAGGPATPTR